MLIMKGNGVRILISTNWPMMKIGSDEMKSKGAEET
jgi:hypothetical protein